MTQIVVGKKNRKKQSKFEKLWERAAKLRASNARFSADLDVVVARMENTIQPLEAELAAQQIPLLQKLLKLGQRKSMTKWERETLDDWIRELVGLIYRYGLVNDKLLDDIACYDAFRMGISLEDDDLPPHKQFAEALKQAEEERAAAAKKAEEDYRQNRDKLCQQIIDELEQKIEKQLDRQLGPEPAQPAGHDATLDLWQDELNEEAQRAHDKYWQERTALKQQLMDEGLAELDAILGSEESAGSHHDDIFGSDDFNYSDFDFSDFEEDANGGFDDANDHRAHDRPAAEALNNNTFQRLFRAAAAKLHPDREPDSEVRKEKQRLMVQLLAARKKGDVMTILDMYETYVGTHEGFSKADQKALIASLQHLIDGLEKEREDIAFRSPSHSMAYDLFYHQNRKKVDAAFAKFSNNIKSQEKAVKQLIIKITSLKTLKPELEERYDDMMYSRSSFEDFIDFAVKQGGF